jgi:hypothetical protein
MEEKSIGFPGEADSMPDLELGVRYRGDGIAVVSMQGRREKEQGR